MSLADGQAWERDHGSDPSFPASLEFHTHSGMTIRQTVALHILCSMITDGIFTRRGDEHVVKRAFEVADEFTKCM